MARYRRTDTGQNLAVSTEITGYAVSTLVYLHSLTGRAEYLDRALAAARFLTRRAWDPQLQTFPVRGRPAGERLHLFLRLRHHRARLAGGCGERRARASFGRSPLRAAGRWRAISRLAACFHPILRLPEKRPVACDHRWSRGSGCYQLKSALAWYDLYEVTGEADFLDRYRRRWNFLCGRTNRFCPAMRTGIA